MHALQSGLLWIWPGGLEPRVASGLIRANRLWRNIQGMLRLTVEGLFIEAEASAGLKAALARAADRRDFDARKEEMTATSDWVHAMFIELIENPARSVTRVSPQTASRDGSSQ